VCPVFAEQDIRQQLRRPPIDALERGYAGISLLMSLTNPLPWK
jgi:hypothetical protein